MNDPSYPHLTLLVKEEGLLFIDLAIAKMLLKNHKSASEDAAAFLCKLVAAARQGHLCVKIEGEKIFPASSDLLEDPKVAETLEQMAERGFKELPKELLYTANEPFSLRPLYREGNHIYLQKNAFFENRFMYHLHRICSYKSSGKLEAPSLSSQLNQKQKEAVEMALSSNISLITGGPGTGKTFTAAQIVKTYLHFQKKDPRIILAAPTGKAAAHLEKNVRKALPTDARLRSGTLHMLLSIKSSEDMLKTAAPLHADLIVVDEASMIDARLFSYFLSSIEEGSRVVLMGDKDQLPPVDNGSLFADLVDLSLKGAFIACAELKDCLRSDRRQILDFAAAVNARELDKIQEILKNEDPSLQRTTLFSGVKSLKKAYEGLWQFAKPRFPDANAVSIDPSILLQKFDQFRILSCMRKGPVGVDAINSFFVEKYLSEVLVDEYLACPILISKNDYTLELFNGDVGVLLQRKKKSGRMFDEEDMAYFYDKSSTSVRKIPALMLPSFEYAYCLSVHKSQGSEYDQVLILAPEGSGAFGKEVLYTAATRAKSSVFIDTEDDVLKKLIYRSSRKISGLHARLQLTGGSPCYSASFMASSQL